MTKRALNATEAKVYTAVRAFHRLDPPRAPTLQEIASVLGWKSTSAAHEYVRRLEAAGYVRRRARHHAGIELAE